MRKRDMNCTQPHAMHGIPMLRIEFSLSFIDLVTLWQLLCQK